MELRRLRMNRKGDEGDWKTMLTAAIVAALVLVVVVMGGWAWFSGKGKAFFSFLPGFNQTKPGVVGTEIFIYDIAQDKVLYYDGVKPVEFETQGVVEVNGKKIYYRSVPSKNYPGILRELPTTFFSYSSRPKLKTLGFVISAPKIASGNPITDIDRAYIVQTWYNYLEWATYAGMVGSRYFFGFDSGIYRDAGGNVYVTSNANSGDIVYDLKLDGSVVELKLQADGRYLPSARVIDLNSPSTWGTAINLKTLFGLATDWRDSFLSKPVKITYFEVNGANEVEKSVYVCIDRKIYASDRDLKVDLTKSVAATATC